ncbi:MAG: MBL fold metallo-hydrolase [Alicyclobacillaceae bacterium]|nr:MBL fold metallo-hydrolase [Alicyclobacillaceae bacterium]
MLSFCLLASGSSGNAVVVCSERTRLLIDAGISARRLERALRSIGMEPGELDAVLITHEHQDHVKGLPVFGRRHSFPVWATEGTWAELTSTAKELGTDRCFTFSADQPLFFGDIAVQPVAVSHDAREPVMFCFYHGQEKLVLATDLGFVSERIKGIMAGANAYILESNHDVAMLRSGPYPWALKRRILGDKGHLSNEAAGEALLDLVDGRTQQVVLAHLSENNNLPELAKLSVETILRQGGLDHLPVEVAPRHEPTPLYTIGRSTISGERRHSVDF